MLQKNPLPDARYWSGVAMLDSGENAALAKGQFEQSLHKAEGYLMLALCER